MRVRPSLKDSAVGCASMLAVIALFWFLAPAALKLVLPVIAR